MIYLKTYTKIILLFTTLIVLTLATIGLIEVFTQKAIFFRHFASNHHYEEKKAIVAAKDLKISSVNRNIVTNIVDDENITIYYWEAKNDLFSLQITETEISFTNTYQFKWSLLGITSKKVRTVVIDLPKKYEKNLTISSINGDITIESAQLKDCNIVTVNGSVYFKDTKANNLSIETNNGRIHLENSSVLGLTANTNNGEMMLKDIKAVNDIQIETMTGNLNVQTLEAIQVSIKNKTGKVKINNLKADTISIECMNSDIYADNLNASFITLKTTNGNIRTSVVGELQKYAIHAKSKDSSFLIDGTKYSTEEPLHPTAMNQIWMDSTNGDIKLNFISNS